MKRILYVLWPALILGAVAVLSLTQVVRAEDFRYSGRLSPSDYLMGTQDQHRDPVFDKYRTIDLGVNLGVGSDCGKIDFKSTLRASLSNILDTKYFGDMGKDILGASPMLLTCYFSPTWCAILKHSQISAHWMSQLRLDQCSIVDKYVDSRVDEYYQERQGCVRTAIDKNGGNMESAMESCRGNNVWQADIANWAGDKYGARSGSNRLIDSSAKWAGMDGDAESKSSVNLIKSLVGDTVVSRGSVSVEYGPRSSPLTPRTYLQGLQAGTYDKLCGKLVKKVEDARGRASVDRLISEDDLKELTPNSERLAVDRQTIQSLAYMSPKQREIACRKLSDAVAMTVFSNDLNRSLDVMTTLGQNPNLPPARKAELDQKRRALKEQVELTVDLQKQRNEPLNAVLSQINDQGQRLRSENVRDNLMNDADAASNRKHTLDFMDCSDGVMCAGGGQ